MPTVPSIRASRPGRLLAAVAGLLAGLTLALAGSSPAHAAIVATGACDDATLSKPFAKWGDANNYKLIPGGDFEGSLNGWTVKGATLSGGGAQGSSKSLVLTPGASVQTPSTCVNTSYPTFRIFARNVRGLGTVLVSVVYRLPILGPTAIPVGTLALQSGDWSPSAMMLTASTVPGLLTNGTAQMALRFTALTGNVAVDSIYVDPRMR
jgi:hypothetical protein